MESTRQIGPSGDRDIGPSENQHQNQEQQQPQDQDQQKLKQRVEALLAKIGAACDELDRLAEENPELVDGVTRGAEEHKDAYLRLKARLSLADQAPRCRWVKQDGTACRSPQMKKHIYCFAHAQMMEARALALSLPAQEDANAIQIGIMRIQKALIEDAISTKKAGLLLYSMQLALQNVGQVTFGQAKAEELVTQTVSLEQAVREDMAIGSSGHRDTPPQPAQNRRGAPSQIAQKAAQSGSPGLGAPAIGPSEKQHQNPRPFTTEDAEEGKGLPQMNADDFDSGKVDEQFVPMPGGHGYTRVRLRVGPEAGTPPRAAVHPSKPTPGLPGTPEVPHELGGTTEVASTHAKVG